MKLLSQKGFTLIELLIAVVVLAIVIATAAPSFTRMIDNNRVTTTANDFGASLALAKSEAVKRSGGVKMVASGGDWDAGYTIGVDANSDGDFADTGEVTLKVVDAPHNSVSVTSALTSIEFNMLGGTADTGSLVFDVPCPRDVCSRTITISSSGVYTMQKESGACECP